MADQFYEPYGQFFFWTLPPLYAEGTTGDTTPSSCLHPDVSCLSAGDTVQYSHLYLRSALPLFEAFWSGENIYFIFFVMKGSHSLSLELIVILLL